jgi:tetratricopeptide (TPR) repeat protein
MLNLGRVLLQRDELEESHELMLEALECRRRSLGESHPDTSSAKVQLAKSRLARSESTAAEALLREALPELQDRLGPEHYASIDASNELGRLLLETGRVKEAEPLLRAKLDFDRANYGPEHISTLKASRSLSRAWFAMGRTAEAFDLFRSTAATARAGASDSHRLMLEQLLSDEGELRLVLKDLSGAQVCYAELYDLRCARLGDSHERSRQCAEKLAAIFDALEAGESGLGHAETATHWRDRAAKRD